MPNEMLAQVRSQWQLDATSNLAALSRNDTFGDSLHAESQLGIGLPGQVGARAARRP